MKKLLPEAVMAIMDQLDRDGMSFQNYKLCGSPYQAVLVLRFTCQKLHIPWLDMEAKKARATESTSTASAPSSHSETQATSYMGMPGYDHHCTKAEDKPWHDSGVDLTTSDHHEEYDRFMPKTHDGPVDKAVSVVCNPVTRTNIAPNKALASSSSSGGDHDASCDDMDEDKYNSGRIALYHNAFIQTDLDFEYMKKIMDEINNREYVPSDTPFSHLRLDKHSAVSPHLHHVPMVQRNRECQTDCQIAGVDTMVYASPHKPWTYLDSNNTSPQPPVVRTHSPVNFHGGRQEFRYPVAKPVPCSHIGVQANLHLESHIERSIGSGNLYARRDDFRQVISHNIGVQTMVHTFSEGTQTYGSALTNLETDNLLTSINKVIQTAGYIEECIHNTPGKELFQNLNVFNNAIEIDDAGIHHFRSASACSLRAPPEDNLRSSSSCSNITVQEEVIRPLSACSERTRYNCLYGPSPLESLSVASKDLELQLGSETDTEADDETLLTPRERYLMKRSGLKVFGLRGNQSEMSSMSSLSSPMVDKGCDPIVIYPKCDIANDPIAVTRRCDTGTDPIKSKVSHTNTGCDPIESASYTFAGTDPVRNNVSLTNTGTNPMEKRVFHTNTGTDPIEKKVFSTNIGTDPMEKRVSHKITGTDPMESTASYHSSGTDLLKSLISHTGTDPCFTLEELVRDGRVGHNVECASQTSFVEVKITTDQTVQIGDSLEDDEQEELYDSFAAYTPGYKAQVPRSSPRSRMTMDSAFSTLVEYEEDGTQTDPPEMVTRGVGIRVKQTSDECQTDKYLVRSLVSEFQNVSKFPAEAPSTSAQSALEVTPKMRKKKARSKSLAAIDVEKGKGKKKKKKHQELLAESLAIPGTSKTRLSSSEEYDLHKIYTEDDFKSFVDNLPVRSSPEIILQKGGSIGVIQGVVKLRSGSAEIGVEALYICVLQEVAIPLYCSGDGHRSCMSGQIIHMDKADWHKDFAILKAKGVFVAVRPGMLEFQTAQNCCLSTMSKKAETGIGRRGSQPNKCKNQ